MGWRVALRAVPPSRSLPPARRPPPPNDRLAAAAGRAGGRIGQVILERGERGEKRAFGHAAVDQGGNAEQGSARTFEQGAYGPRRERIAQAVGDQDRSDTRWEWPAVAN